MKKLAFLKNWAPLIGLVLVVIFFYITTEGRILSETNVRSLLNQVIVIALVSIGAVFIFGSGNFDLSLGGVVALSAVLGGYVAIATGNLLLTFLAIAGVSLGLSLLKGIFASFVEVPMFIVTIVLGFVLSAALLVIMGNESIIFIRDANPPIPALTANQMLLVNLITLGVYFVICVVVFNFTGLGREIKIMGGNPTTARQNGMNMTKVKVLSFLLSGLGIALAAFILLIRTRTLGTTTASSTGIDVLIALVLGGMPLTGGPRARISAGVIGAATITVMNSGLTILGLNLATIQIFRAIVFLAVVYVASMTYRTKLLPR